MKYLSEIFASRAAEALTSRHSPLATRCSARRAISLIEVLISMFVLLFGLMGVAAIFPVGNYYVVEGEKFDLGSGIAQNAFEELKARGILRPEVWVYAHSVNGTLRPVMLPNGSFVNPIPNPPDSGIGPGHAFIIDPLGAASDPTLNHRDIFPYAFDASGNGNTDNPWEPTPTGSILPLAGTRWPVRRINLPIPDPTSTYPAIPMNVPVAETIFRLRDDLAVEQPDESDRPSIQRWDTADIDPTTGNNNNTPNDPRDDTLLRRQYKGDYSWLATIVPTTGDGLEALQPASANFGEISCDVSVVVFRKREETPSATSERLIYAELLQGGELLIYDEAITGNYAADDPLPDTSVVDDAVEDIRPGNWISLMGVNQTTGAFVMKWYRMLSLDDETSFVKIPSRGTGLNGIGRRAMLIGPNWPAPPGGATSVQNLRAGIFPGAISVVTKPLTMESSSLWELQ